jgi:hypothetical protein
MLSDINLKLLLLIAGILCLFIGITPMISDYFDEINHKFWRSDSKLLSERNKYLYNQYIRQIGPLLLGIALISYVLFT